MIKFHLRLMDTKGEVFDRTVIAEDYYKALDKASHYYGIVSCLQYRISFPRAC